VDVITPAAVLEAAIEEFKATLEEKAATRAALAAEASATGQTV